MIDRNWKAELAEALGLDPKKTKSITIEVPPGSAPPIVIATLYAPLDNGWSEVLKQFALKVRSEEKP